MRLQCKGAFLVMKKQKFVAVASFAASMLLAGCGPSGSSASSSEGSLSSSNQPLRETISFSAASIPNATKITSATTDFYTVNGLTVTGVNGLNVYGTGNPYIKIAVKSTAGSLTFSLDGVKAITSVRMNAALASGTSQVVTFADSANPLGVTVDVAGTAFADYAFPSLTDTTGSVLSFTISVPTAAPLYLASLTFGLQNGVETKANSMTLSTGDISDLPIGETRQIGVTTDPVGVTYPTAVFSSDHDNIASVSSSGILTAKAVGSAVISVTIPGAHTVSGNDIVKTVTVSVIDPNVFLLASTKDGSTYGGNAKPATVDGTGYSATKSRDTQHQLSAASGILDLSSLQTQKILVIPVCFLGDENVASDATRNNIYKTFFGDASETGWESLASYYWKSSFQQLLLQGTVSEWWQCGYSATTVAGWTDSEWSSFDPTWRLLEEAVKWYKARYNTTGAEFDQDNDGALDAVWMVYSRPQDTTGTNSLLWAYTFEDLRASGEEVGFKYAWASYRFMYEGYGGKLDAHTFIHETGHMMGLDDYYTYSGASNYAPMAGLDMMDNNIIDHNAYSKFAYGWTSPYVVSDSCSITLHPASTTGEAILLPDAAGWNGSAFDEYVLLEFYTPTNLNYQDSQPGGYPGNNKRGFTENGVRIYHVDARMVSSVYNGKGFGAWEYTEDIKYVYVAESPYAGTTYTVLAHSNSDSRQQLTDGIEKRFRLIQEMDCERKRDFTYGVSQDTTADNTTLFQAGDSFSLGAYHDSFARFNFDADGNKITSGGVEQMNDGSTLPYSVSFSAMSDDSITVNVTKAA